MTPRSSAAHCTVIVKRRIVAMAARLRARAEPKAEDRRVVLERAARENPTDHVPCDGLAEHLRDVVGDLPAAVAWFEESFARHPVGGTLERIAEILRDRLDRPYEALLRLTRAAQVGPSSHSACDRIAEIFRDRFADPEQAIAWFERSFELHPVPWPLERIAEIHRDRLGDPAAAVTWFTRATEVASDDYWACDRIAEIFRDRLADPRRAIAWFECSFERHPIPWPLERIAEIHRDQLADPRAAIDWWRRAAHVDPSATAACDQLAEHYHYRLGDLEQAIHWYRQSATRQPRSWPLMQIAGIYCDHLADHEQAIRCYLEAARVEPVDPLACTRLGELYLHALEDPMRALGWLEAADTRRRSAWGCERIAEIYFEHLADPEQGAHWLACARAAPDMPGRLYLDPVSDPAGAYGDPAVAAGAPEPSWHPIEEGRALLTRWNLVVERDEEGPCFSRRRGVGQRAVFVVTVPKSGTYLVNELLVALGLENCGVHFAAQYLSDHRDVPALVSRQYPGCLDRPCPFSAAVPLIRPGQFGYGHIECVSRNVELLRPLQKVFLGRDLRDVVASAMRQRAEMRKDDPLTPFLKPAHGAERLHRYLDACGRSDLFFWRAIARWAERDDVLTLRYETLMGDDGRSRQIEQVEALARWLGVECSPQRAETVLDRALGKGTATSSGRRSGWRECWDETIERLFVTMGLAALNRRLGYE